MALRETMGLVAISEIFTHRPAGHAGPLEPRGRGQGP
jgi:hypothetical protein